MTAPSDDEAGATLSVSDDAQSLHGRLINGTKGRGARVL